MNPAPTAVAIVAAAAPPKAKPSNYPSPFAARVAGREKRPLGDLFGLTNFGANLTRLAPGAISALRHAHTVQDEFIYILQGGILRRHSSGGILRDRPRYYDKGVYWQATPALLLATAASCTASSTRRRR